MNEASPDRPWVLKPQEAILDSWLDSLRLKMNPSESTGFKFGWSFWSPQSRPYPPRANEVLVSVLRLDSDSESLRLNLNREASHKVRSCWRA